MILLHGGITYSMLCGLIGGFIGAAILFFWIILRVIKRSFNTNYFQSLSAGDRVSRYVLLFVGAWFAALLAFYVLTILIVGTLASVFDI